MQHNVHTLALKKAATILGGSAALHDYLRVPSLDLLRWMAGQQQPPMNIFLRVVDLLDAHAGDKTPYGTKAGKTHHWPVLRSISEPKQPGPTPSTAPAH